mmetsp:Transcript_85692/g.265290  ORF Transcript_85692/g.265290 Transcript_85692/m.265290 type:complete len:214 (-) Transcript_85692:2-643(-)
MAPSTTTGPRSDAAALEGCAPACPGHSGMGSHMLLTWEPSLRKALPSPPAASPCSATSPDPGTWTADSTARNMPPGMTIRIAVMVRLTEESSVKAGPMSSRIGKADTPTVSCPPAGPLAPGLCSSSLRRGKAGGSARASSRSSKSLGPAGCWAWSSEPGCPGTCLVSLLFGRSRPAKHDSGMQPSTSCGLEWPALDAADAMEACGSLYGHRLV